MITKPTVRDKMVPMSVYCHIVETQSLLHCSMVSHVVVHMGYLLCALVTLVLCAGIDLNPWLNWMRLKVK